MLKVTGWDNGLCQDYDKGLGRWFANRLGARQQLRQDFKMTQVLIDRATLEQLVAALNEVDQHVDLKRYDTAPNEVLFDVVMEAMVKGRAALANAEPTGWIAAKDRMPPPQVRVLGFEPQYNIVDVDMWFGPDFNWGYSYWMPLPASPKDKS